jgi:two-component system cell cycle response regulator CpdR
MISLSVIAADLPSKKTRKPCGTPLRDTNRAGSLHSSWFQRKLMGDPDVRAQFAFTRNLPPIGLSERIGPLIRVRCPTAMHKILLAEDDNDMRRFLVKALENAGFQVSPHDNGLSAYQRLREEPFEMLLTDIVMPEMDGIELARRASELDPDIKIMFITGFAAVALNSDSEAPKNAKVLSKPVHLRELVSEVNKLLAA